MRLPVARATAAATRRESVTQASATTAAAQSAAASTGLFAVLFNQSPTVNPTHGDQTLYGHVSGAVNALDPDSNTLTYNVIEAPTQGEVVLSSDGSYTYTPDETLASTGTTDSFKIGVSDEANGFHLHGVMGLLNLLTFGLIGAAGHDVIATVKLNVAPFRPPNSAPTGTATVDDPDLSTGVVTGSVNGFDIDGDPLSYGGTSATVNGSVTVAADGSFTYTPTPVARHAASESSAGAADKIDSFTVTIADGQGGMAAVPVTVAISPSNASPTGAANVGTANTSTGLVTGNVAAVDDDLDPLTYSGSTTTAKGSFAIDADGDFSYTPTATARHAASAVGASNFDKTDTVTVTVTDGHGGSLAVPVTIAISATNTSPTVSVSFDPTVGTSGVISGTLGAADADGDTLNFSGTSSAKGSVTVGANGTFVYTPTPTARHAASALGATTAATTDAFTVTVADGHGGTVAIPFAVTISPTNTVPTATAVIGDPNALTGVVTGSIGGADADGDSLAYSGTTATAKGSATVFADGSFTYTPTNAARHAAAALGAPAADLTDGFTVTVADGHGGSVIVPVVVAVRPLSNPPTGAVAVGTPNPSTGIVTGVIAAIDPDGDPLSYIGPPATAKGSVTVAANGTFTYTPTSIARHAASALGATTAVTTDTFAITVSDGHGGNLVLPVTVIVGQANAGPTGAATVGSPNASTGVVTGTVVGSDVDGDVLTYSGSTTTAKGSVTVAANGTFTYTPTSVARHAASAIGAGASVTTDSFAVTVSDGHGGMATVPVSVTISPANAAPTGTPTVGAPNATTGVVTGAIIGSDTDGDALTYSGSTATTKGTVTVAADGTFTYTPTDAARTVAASTSATSADLSDAFIVTVRDGYGGIAAVPVTVAVSPATPHLTFSFVYGSGAQYWSANARNALSAVASWLSSNIVVTAPVTLTYTILGTNSPNSGSLGSAYASFASSSPGFYGTVAQTKILTGVDANGSAADAQISMNFAYPWALGSSVGSSQYDFTSTAIHEFLHTLGFLTGIDAPSDTDTTWTTYDSFMVTADGTRIIGDSYVWNTAYDPNLTGGNGGVYFGGPNAVAAYGGLVPLYTPSAWSYGSSITHLSDTNVNASAQVMNPFEGFGVGARTLSAVEVGILRDMGYTVTPQSPLYAFIVVGFGILRRRRGK